MSKAKEFSKVFEGAVAKDSNKGNALDKVHLIAKDSSGNEFSLGSFSYPKGNTYLSTVNNSGKYQEGVSKAVKDYLDSLEVVDEPANDYN